MSLKEYKFTFPGVGQVGGDGGVAAMGWIIGCFSLVFEAIWSIRWFLAFVIWTVGVFVIAMGLGVRRTEDRWRKIVITWIKEKKLDRDARRSLRQVGLDHSNINASNVKPSGAMVPRTETVSVTDCANDV